MTFEELLDRYDLRLRRAFQAGVDEITSKVVLKQVVEALERNDVSGALEALYIDRTAWAEFEDAVREAYGDGGDAAIAELGQLRDQAGERFVFRFNSRDLAAEGWLLNNSSTRITNITESTREIARQRLQEGLSQGQNPRQTAIDVVGRLNPRTGKRYGGVIGLSDPQASAVAKARQELLDGDYAAYVKREKRDRRFDGLVRKAMDGETLARDRIDTMVRFYSNRLLKLRGETIARTETLAALNASKQEAMRQLVASGKVPENAIRRVWKATRDLRTRDTHLILDGEAVGLNEPFRTARGASLMYPGDPSAPAEERINCRCSLHIRIQYGTNLE